RAPAGRSSRPSAHPPPPGYASSRSRISPGPRRRKPTGPLSAMTMPPLSPDLFARLDESPDDLFYATPRFVTHIDDAAIAAVTQLYREHFPPGGAILDLMSSWISHLPPEI